jgi:hypothetical protein
MARLLRVNAGLPGARFDARDVSMSKDKTSANRILVG